MDHYGRETGLLPQRRDALENRERILKAARELFEERGVTRVNMEDIARAACVGKGTLYRRFPNKGLLCQALLDEPTRQFQREALELTADTSLSSLGKLDRFLDRLVWFMERNLDLLYGGRESLSGTARLVHVSSPAYDWLRWTALTLLQGAVRSGEVSEDLDVEYVAVALLASLNTDIYYQQRRVLDFPPERISAGLRSLVPGSR